MFKWRDNCTRRKKTLESLERMFLVSINYSPGGGGSSIAAFLCMFLFLVFCFSYHNFKSTDTLFCRNPPECLVAQYIRQTTKCICNDMLKPGLTGYRVCGSMACSDEHKLFWLSGDVGVFVLYICPFSLHFEH